MKKLYIRCISLSLAAILIMILCLTGCAQKGSAAPKANEKLDFAKYESDELYNIERIGLIGALDSKCATYKFTYLSDNYEIKGYISIPTATMESGEPCKCVLYNRGGNSDIGMLEDGTTASICAELDRVVIASQYRGADGSGGKDQFGGNDLHDVIKLIDFCENNLDFVSMDDFCVAGVSRGGMMTYMTARADKRVKRIISVSGVSDLFSSYEERDDMKTVLRNYIGCTPMDNPAEYMKRSAVNWADEIKIPVMIIHCEKDERVSFRQAETMYELLKDSTDCTFITHDDDVHGTHSDDFEKMREWLND